jgi:hypothetical protein
MKTEENELENLFNELPGQKLSGKELARLLENLTGFKYKFKTSPEMKWGRDGDVKTVDEQNPDGFSNLSQKIATVVFSTGTLLIGRIISFLNPNNALYYILSSTGRNGNVVDVKVLEYAFYPPILSG